MGRFLILSIVFLDALGYGLLIPVLPGVIRRFEADPSFVSRWFGYFIAIYALIQFLAAPILGSLSDRYGRRPVLLSSLAGAAVDYLLMAFAPSIALLFVGRAVSGLTGAGGAVASSYMADVCDQESSPSSFGLLAAAMGAGIVAGPAAGGALAKWGAAAPFICAAVLNFASFAAVLFLLPESLGTRSRRKLDVLRSNAFASLARAFWTSRIRWLFWCYLLVYLAGRSTSSMWALFTERRFGWSSGEIGTSLAFMGLVLVVAQSSLPRIAVARLGEDRSLRLGLLCSVATYVGIGLATRGWMLYAFVASSAFATVVGPLLQSMMSRAVPADAQGELQGSLSCIASLTAVAGPLLYTHVFARAVTPGCAGAPFLLAAALCLLSWIVVVRRRGAPQH